MSKQDHMGALRLHRLCTIHAEQFSDLRLLEFACFWSRMICNVVDMAKVLRGLFDVVSCHANSPQTSIPYGVKFGQRVKSFLTVIGTLYSDADVVIPVCIQLIIINGLGFLVPIYLAIMRLLLL